MTISSQKKNGDSKLKLSSWFEIDELDYCQYVLQGYEITADENWVTWWVNGRLHRTDGPAIIWADGRQAWCVNGEFHRIDGPAAIWADGSQSWWLDGKAHRTDGPAVIDADGSEEWYLNGKELTEEEWRQQVETHELV